MGRDKTFLVIVGVLFAFLFCFGVGAVVLSITGDPSDQVSLRVISAIGGMFSSVIGVVLGYLVGRRNGNGGGNA